MKSPTMIDTVARLQREAEDAAGLEPLPDPNAPAEIERCYRGGESAASIAARLGCHFQTVYNRLAKIGTVLSAAEWTERRFWQKVDKSGECWLWLGWKDKNGYGYLNRNKQRTLVHRYAYELLVGPIPASLTIDHLCRVHNCVRPDHLEPVTRAENVMRGVGPCAVNARRTQCPRGHPYSEQNTRIDPKTNWRCCKTCDRARRAA